MKLKLSRDTNGNKTLKCSLPIRRGFSVQTNGNLPRVHAMDSETFNKPKHSDRSFYHIAIDELRMHIKEYGTDRQKRILGVD